MLKKLILAGCLVGVSSSLFAQEITTERDLKKAIAKLIVDKVNHQELKVVSDKVELNSKNIKTNTSDILEIQKQLEQIKKSGKTGTFKGIVGRCWALHIRSNPDPRSAVRGYLKRGDNVTIIKSSENGWFNVITDNGSGWVSGKYIVK